MTIAVVLALVLLAWVVLLLLSRRDGWNYVGEPPTPLHVQMRKLELAMDELRRSVAEALTPALLRANAALERLLEATKREP